MVKCNTATTHLTPFRLTKNKKIKIKKQVIHKQKHLTLQSNIALPVA